MASCNNKLIILTLIFGFVHCGRKGSSSSKSADGDHDDPDPFKDDPTEIPTEYFYDVNNAELQENFTVIPGTWKVANVSIESAAKIGKQEECYSEPMLCTYCRNEVGNSTTDIQCRDTGRELCWSSTGCYRMTFRDVTTGFYHIEKGCWYESFQGRYGTCNRECKKKRDGLPEVAERGGCFCEMCHGPMCNRDILVSAGARVSARLVLGILFAVVFAGL